MQMEWFSPRTCLGCCFHIFNELEDVFFQNSSISSTAGNIIQFDLQENKQLTNLKLTCTSNYDPLKFTQRV